MSNILPRWFAKPADLSMASNILVARGTDEGDEDEEEEDKKDKDEENEDEGEGYSE
jgi:hypothetical protein